MSRGVLRASVLLLFMFTSINAARAQSEQLEYSQAFTFTLTVTHPPTTCGINTTNTTLDYGENPIPASTRETEEVVRINPSRPRPPSIHFFGDNVLEYTATFGALPSTFPNLTMVNVDYAWQQGSRNSNFTSISGNTYTGTGEGLFEETNHYFRLIGAVRWRWDEVLAVLPNGGEISDEFTVDFSITCL